MKKLTCLVLIFALLLPLVAYCTSADTDHDKDLKEVLWGNDAANSDNDELAVLQWAAYFAVDCTASTKSSDSDRDGLAILRKYGVEGVPNQVSDFHYEGENSFNNQHHERYTHLGWNHTYGSGKFDSLGDIAHWSTIRKPLLINAVRAVFVGGKKDLWSKIDFAGLFHHPKTEMSEQQIEGMSALIYYVHVLGDHCYNTRATVNDRIPLARRTENDSNPSLIYDLKKHLDNLFPDQHRSSEYRSLMKNMDRIHDDIRALLGDNDYPSAEQYEAYKNMANDLMSELKKRIPRLMKNSAFFPVIFAEPAA